jgi:hypothetical protein
MAAPSLLERAKRGDGEAIVALLNRALQRKGITVEGECQGYILIVWLQGSQLPPQKTTVAYIRRGLGKLMIPSIGIVQIHGQQEGAPEAGWYEEISLLDAFADSFDSPDLQTDSIDRSHSPAGLQPVPETLAFPESLLPPSTDLEWAYQVLQVTPGAALETVKNAYFQQKAQLISQGNRQAIGDLKQAYHLLMEPLQRSPTGESFPIENAGKEAVPFNSDPLVRQLQTRGLKAQIKQQGTQLKIRLAAESATQPNRAVAIIYTLLDQNDLAAWGMADLKTVVVYGLGAGQSTGWRRTLAMPVKTESPHDTDLLSFQNRYVSALGFPILMLLGIAMNTLPIVNMLLFGVKIWFHEFGHATVAWLGGRRAIPLPFGWTNVSEERSLVVYLGVLVLLGLMFWVGRRENLRWPVILAVVLALVQFFMTWLLPEAQFLTLLSFGGIGGELYLCTLLMVSFYFALPEYWRWDFYRYPVVLGASFTFWGQFWLWRQIRRGLEPIPWGSMWGGSEHGDMNNLRYAGWSDQHIIHTYSTIGNLCLVALLSVYFYFALRQNRQYLFALMQRWLAK